MGKNKMIRVPGVRDDSGSDGGCGGGGSGGSDGDSVLLHGSGYQD